MGKLFLISCFMTSLLSVQIAWAQTDSRPIDSLVDQSNEAVNAMVKKAHMLESQNKFAEAASVWNQVASNLSSIHGAESWRVTNAKLAQQVATRQAEFNQTQLAELQQVKRLQEHAMKAATASDAATSLLALQKAESTLVKLFGEQSHMVAQVKTRIAGMLELQGQLQDAWQTYRDALAIARRTFGPQHPDTELVYYKLGLMLHRGGQSARALDHLQQSVNISKTIYGDEHPSYADRLTTAGVALQATGQYQRALEYLLAGEKIQEKVLGADSERRGLTLKDIGVTYLSMGEAGQAQKFLQAATHIFDAQRGTRDAFTLKTKSQLATALAMGGKHQEAEQLLEQVLDGNRITHGYDAEITAKNEFQLGVLKGKRGDYENAEPLLKKALETQTVVLGREHRSTQRTAVAYAQLLERTERAGEADQLRQSFSRTAAAPQQGSVKR